MKRKTLIVVCLALMASLSNVACKSEQKKAADTAQPQQMPAAEATTGEGNVQLISEQQFSELVANFASDPQMFIGENPCMIDVYADWCGPCKQMSPIVDNLAKKYAGKIDFYKVNIDNAQALAAAYRIEGIPAFMFCSTDGNIKMEMGARSESEMDALLQTLLK